MRSPWRPDDRGVSPVIATILLVAITVILAGVLYVMVSGLLVPNQNGPRALGVALQKSTDGLNWTLSIVSTPAGLAPSSVRLTISAPNGTTVLSKTFASLAYSTDGAVFLGSGSTLASGDRVLASTTRYGSHDGVQIADSVSLLYSAVFP